MSQQLLKVRIITKITKYDPLQNTKKTAKIQHKVHLNILSTFIEVIFIFACHCY